MAIPVFVSYSRRDASVLEELRPMLRLLGESTMLHFWDDRQIQPGDRWEAAIDGSLNKARLALLLVSTHYLSSEYVKERELPQLLQGAREGRIRVFWVAVSPTLWELTELQHFQAVNDPTRPLSTLSEADRQQELVAICRSIKKTLETAAPQPGPAPRARRSPGRRVAILYKRHAQPDEHLQALFARELTAAGHAVFVDRHVRIGQAWASRIEQEIRTADAVIPIVSRASFESEMLAYEVQVAADANATSGRPVLLPVRVGVDESIPGELGAVLAPIQYELYNAPGDEQRVLTSLLEALETDPLLHVDSGPPIGDLRDPTGAEPLDSTFYIERAADRSLNQFVDRRDGVARIHGPRQSGKSSLLARVMHRARSAGVRVLFCDLQSLSGKDLRSLDSFYLAMLRRFAAQLPHAPDPAAQWDAELGANINLEAYLRDHLLAGAGRVLIALDETDRLFDRDYSGDFFGLARSWFNNRATHGEPWTRLSQIYAYATEAALFIADLDQSPFNVGREFPMEDFTDADIRELDRRHGSRINRDLRRFIELFGGHPYLVRRALFEMAERGLDVAALESDAAPDKLDGGPFGDHLRRLLVVLTAGGGAVRDLVSDTLAHTATDRRLPLRVPHDAFARAKASGLLRGSETNASFRCGLYERYIAFHMAGVTPS